jgi:hypothetical protein
MTFKLNMTDKEANSKDFELPPSGNYLVRITDLSLEEVKKAGDNFGKPYWKATVTVEEGQYAGTPIISTVMLFPGALYTIKQMCEAINPEFIDGNDINLPTAENGMPSPDPWMGQLVHIKGTKFAAGTKRRNGETREYDEFQIKWKKAPTSASRPAGAGGLPMPS